jgi:hypothetical protein
MLTIHVGKKVPGTKHKFLFVILASLIIGYCSILLCLFILLDTCKSCLNSYLLRRLVICILGISWIHAVHEDQLPFVHLDVAVPDAEGVELHPHRLELLGGWPGVAAI